MMSETVTIYIKANPGWFIVRPYSLENEAAFYDDDLFVEPEFAWEISTTKNHTSVTAIGDEGKRGESDFRDGITTPYALKRPDGSYVEDGCVSDKATMIKRWN